MTNLYLTLFIGKSQTTKNYSPPCTFLLGSDFPHDGCPAHEMGSAEWHMSSLQGTGDILNLPLEVRGEGLSHAAWRPLFSLTVMSDGLMILTGSKEDGFTDEVNVGKFSAGKHSSVDVSSSRFVTVTVLLISETFISSDG